MEKRFPGYSACLALMRKQDPQVKEDGFHLLLPWATEYIDPLTVDFSREHDHGLKCWLLELIAEARSPKALDVLSTQLESSDEVLRSWATHGLQQPGTKDARQALCEAGVRSGSRPTRP
jgi:hypothetical protein